MKALLWKTAIEVAVIAALSPTFAIAQDYQRETDRLAEEVAAAVTKGGLHNIAVMDFTDLRGDVQEIGRFIAEELTTSLVLQPRSFRTIDRANLRSILAEQKLTMTGLVDPQNAKKLRLSGVDGLIRGTLTPFGDGIRLTVQIISVETAQIIGGARGTIPKTSAMDNLDGSIENSITDSGSSQVRPAQSSRPKTRVFQDGFLRVTLQFFRRDSANQIKAIFLIENLADGERNLRWSGLQLVDDQAGQWRPSECSGIDCGYVQTPVSAAAQITAVAVFKSEQGKSPTTFNVVGSVEIIDVTRSRYMYSSPTFLEQSPGK